MADISLRLRPLGLPAIDFLDVHEDKRQACEDLILLPDPLGGSPQRPIFLQGGRDRGGRDSGGNRRR